MCGCSENILNWLQSHRVSIHSDDCKGKVFFALQGDRHDGHQFIDKAVERGAVAIVGEKGKQVNVGVPVVEVYDPKAFLLSWAQEKRRRMKKVIGITGTCGKTTTKEFLYAFLKTSMGVTKTLHNYNTPEGIALSLINQPSKEVFVMEMGVRQPGDMNRLIELYQPDWGVLTIIDHAHLTFFDSHEDYVSQKLLLLKNVTCAYSGASLNNVHLSDIKLSSSFEALPHYLYQNAQLAANVAKGLGVCESVIRTVTAPKIPGRFNVIKEKGITLIDDSYNASPLSMKEAINSLPTQNRLIGVLGSMKELGEHSLKFHQEILNLALKRFDHLFLLGDEWKHNTLELSDIIKSLKALLTEGDVLLLKGSNAHRLSYFSEEIFSN